MSTHWRKKQSQDRYFRQAKEEGYRARSAFKLIQMNETFKLIQRGDRVLDLGAAPGGWSQVALELVGPQGRVIALDIAAMEPIPGVTILQGDMNSPQVQEKVLKAASGEMDVVLCDAAPSVSGLRDRDHTLSIELAESALHVARQLLRPGGSFVVKVFEGESFPAYLQEVRRSFAAVNPHHPAASREESREIYVVARGYKR